MAETSTATLTGASCSIATKRSWHAAAKREVALWCLVVLALAVFDINRTHGPGLTNDSYQYLSMAENLRDHHACLTSIVHFDVERAHGKIPAPETTFACGYPALISAFSWSHLRLEYLGTAISIAAGVITTILLWQSALLLGLSPFSRRMCLFLWVLNTQVGLFWTGVMTESLFSAIEMGALTLLLWSEQKSSISRGWGPPVALFLVGVGYWVRYAGLLVVAAVGLYAVSRFVKDRTRRTVWASSLVVLGVTVLACMARNVRLAGVWEGGNTKAVHNPVFEVLRSCVVAGYQLVMGPYWSKNQTTSAFALACALAAVFGLVLLLASIVLRQHQYATVFRDALSQPQFILLTLWLAVYCGGLLYLAFVTPISFGARMFVPAVPAALLWSATLFGLPPHSEARISARVRMGGLVLFLSGYVAANLAGLSLRPVPFEHQLVADALNGTTSGGEALSMWIKDNVPRSAVFVADDGQATAYVLKHDTVSLVPEDFSDTRWEQGQVRTTMNRFGADYMILYPGLPSPAARTELQSRFLHNLIAGQVPNWLELAAENAQVRIFRRRHLQTEDNAGH